MKTLKVKERPSIMVIIVGAFLSLFIGIIDLSMIVVILMGRFGKVISSIEGGILFKLFMIICLGLFMIIMPILLVNCVKEELKLIKEGKDIIEIDEKGIKFKNYLTERYDFISWRSVEGVNYKYACGKGTHSEIIIYVSSGFSGKCDYMEIKTNDGNHKMRGARVNFGREIYMTRKVYNVISKNMGELEY